MMSFTTLRKQLKKIGSRLLVAAFWLLIWQAVYLAVAQEIRLVSPVRAFARLFSLSQDRVFWVSVALTCLRVLLSFFAALVAGSLLAALCARFSWINRLTAPLMGIIRATPVASFIVLAWLWLQTDSIPVFSAFLMVLPMVWANLMAGILAADVHLLEMARVFRLSRLKVLRYIYLPAILPHFVTACSSGLGFAWKSAVAAEVICLPRAAVGRQIYNAKIYLETADLFAWTIAVILISLVIEKYTVALLRRLSMRLGSAIGDREDEDVDPI